MSWYLDSAINQSIQSITTRYRLPIGTCAGASFFLGGILLATGWVVPGPFFLEIYFLWSTKEKKIWSRAHAPVVPISFDNWWLRSKLGASLPITKKENRNVGTGLNVFPFETYWRVISHVAAPRRVTPRRGSHAVSFFRTHIHAPHPTQLSVCSRRAVQPPPCHLSGEGFWGGFRISLGDEFRFYVPHPARGSSLKSPRGKGEEEEGSTTINDGLY